MCHVVSDFAHGDGTNSPDKLNTKHLCEVHVMFTQIGVSLINN